MKELCSAIKECIREFEQADDNSTYSRITSGKCWQRKRMLPARPAYTIHEAEKVLCKLEENRAERGGLVRETRLGVIAFLAHLAERNETVKKAEEHVRTAVMALEDMTQALPSEYDSIQNLLQYVEKIGKPNR